MILCAAIPVYQHAAQQHLRVRQPGRRRLAEPLPAFHRIGRHAVALGEQSAIPELRVRDSFRRTLQPMRRLLSVPLRPHAFQQAHTQIERRRRISAFRRRLEPFPRARQILGRTAAAQGQIAKIRLRRRIPVRGGNAKPGCRLLRIPPYPGAGEIQQSQGPRGGAMSGLGGAAIPHGGFQEIRRQPRLRPAATPSIQIANQRRRLRIAGQGRPAQPGFARQFVYRDAAPLHQRQPIARLGVAMALLSRDPISLRRRRQIDHAGQPAFLQFAQHIPRGRQSALRRRFQPAHNLRLGLRVRHAARQGHRMAQRPLRGATLGGQPIQIRRLVRVARILRPMGQDIGQHRLPIRGSRIRRPPGPIERGQKARRGRRSVGGAGRVLEQFRRGFLARRRPQATQQQGRQQSLRRHMIPPRRPFQPAHALRRVARHAMAIQIGVGHPQTGFRHAARGKPREHAHRTHRIPGREVTVRAFQQHAVGRKARQPVSQCHGG